MELLQFLQFKSIAELGNISNAAKSLFISQPALSQMLNKFEAELGVKLFDRTKNSITLNYNGKLALRHINNILSEIETMKVVLKKNDSKNKIVNISSVDDPSLRYFIIKLLENYPDLQVNTNLSKHEKLKKAILDKAVDISFTAEPIQDTNIYTEFIFEDIFFVSVPETHEFFNRSTLNLNDLNGQRFLKPYGESELFHRLNESSRNKHVTIENVMQRDFALYKEMTKTTKLLVTSSTMSFHDVRPNPYRKNILVVNPEISVKYYASCHKDNVNLFVPYIDAIKNSY